jgi:hypothetical protein
MDFLHIIFDFIFCMLFSKQTGYSTRAKLRAKGYDWISLEDCEFLAFKFRNPAKKLPPWEEAAVIPGSRKGVSFLVQLLRIRARTLRENRGFWTKFSQGW